MIYNKPIEWGAEKAKAFLKEPRIKKMIAMVPPNKIVIDLGCYTGDIAHELLKKSRDVFGYDCNSRFVAMTKAKGIDAYLADFEVGVPGFPKICNVVVAGELIEHIVRTEVFLDNCFRILDDDGELIISTPNLAYIGHRIKGLFGKAPGIMGYESGEDTAGPGHVRYFTLKTLTELLQKHGFCVTNVRGSDIKGNELLGDLFPTLAFHLIIKAQKYGT